MTVITWRETKMFGLQKLLFVTKDKICAIKDGNMVILYEYLVNKYYFVCVY